MEKINEKNKNQNDNDNEDKKAKGTKIWIGLSL